MKKRIFLVVLVLLTGCAGTWEHANKSQQAYDVDHSACLAMGGQASAGGDPFGNYRKQAYQQCMQGKGYRWLTPREVYYQNKRG
jgi:hypothetical protein